MTALLELNDWLARLTGLYSGLGVDDRLRHLAQNCAKLGGALEVPLLEDPSTNVGFARSAAKLRRAGSFAFVGGNDEVQLSVKRLHGALRAIVEAVARKDD